MRASTSGNWLASYTPMTRSNQESWIKVHQRRLLDKGKIEKLVASLRSIASPNPEVGRKDPHRGRLL